MRNTDRPRRVMNAPGSCGRPAGLRGGPAAAAPRTFLRFSALGSLLLVGLLPAFTPLTADAAKLPRTVLFEKFGYAE